RARDVELPRGISDALSRIARADRPHALCPRLSGQARYSIHTSPDLVGIGRLEVLELEINLALVAKIEPDERRPEHRPGDPLARLFNIADRDRPDRIDHLPLLLGSNFF